jgi:hypothetical protein
MDWSVAEALPTGHNTRVDCWNECGDGKTMVVNHHSSHYSVYCHRCGYKTGKDKGYQTLEQLNATREMDKLAHEQTQTLALPLDTNYDPDTWPTEARMWLYKASIYGKLLTLNRIGYSPKLNRVVLPTYTGTTLNYYQLRKLTGTGAKYINPRVNKAELMHWTMPDSKQGDETIAVVVEDVLSSIRIGQHYPTAALLGTKLSTQQASKLSRFKTVISWFDNDKAGYDCANQIRLALGLVTNTKNIKTELDPKEYSSSEIKSIIGNVL